MASFRRASAAGIGTAPPYLVQNPDVQLAGALLGLVAEGRRRLRGARDGVIHLLLASCNGGGDLVKGLQGALEANVDACEGGEEGKNGGGEIKSRSMPRHGQTGIKQPRIALARCAAVAALLGKQERYSPPVVLTKRVRASEVTSPS